LVGIFGFIVPELECIAGNPDPTDLFCRDTDHQRIGFDISVDDRTGADKGIFTDGDTADDCSIGTDGTAFFQKGLFKFILALNKCSGVDDIGKNHGWTKKDIIFYLDTLIDADVVLDFDPTAYSDIRSYDTVLSKRAVRTDSGVWHDMGKVPDFSVFADLDVLIYKRRRMIIIVLAFCFFVFSHFESPFFKS